MYVCISCKHACRKVTTDKNGKSEIELYLFISSFVLQSMTFQ